MKKMLIGLLLVASVGTVVGCTDTKVVDKKGTEIAEEAKDKVTEETKQQITEEIKETIAEEAKEKIVEEAKEQVVIPETIEAKIGDELVFTNGYGEFIFKVNNVYLTEDRNQFADPVNYVVIIEYTVTNTNIATEDFYFDLGYDAKFYDANGFECDTYPATVVDTFGIHDISPNRSSSSAAAIGITCDKPYLEMEIANILYKFNL